MSYQYYLMRRLQLFWKWFSYVAHNSATMFSPKVAYHNWDLLLIGLLLNYICMHRVPMEWGEHKLLIKPDMQKIYQIKCY